jgi:hypothetical protein
VDHDQFNVNRFDKNKKQAEKRKKCNITQSTVQSLTSYIDKEFVKCKGYKLKNIITNIYSNFP